MCLSQKRANTTLDIGIFGAKFGPLTSISESVVNRQDYYRHCSADYGKQKAEGYGLSDGIREPMVKSWSYPDHNSHTYQCLKSHHYDCWLYAELKRHVMILLGIDGKQRCTYKLVSEATVATLITCGLAATEACARAAIQQRPKLPVVESRNKYCLCLSVSHEVIKLPTRICRFS